MSNRPFDIDIPEEGRRIVENLQRALREEEFNQPLYGRPGAREIIDGVGAHLILEPRRLAEMDYFCEQLHKAAQSRAVISVSVRGFGMDACIHKAEIIRLPNFRRYTASEYRAAD